jgi:aminopeptidase N
VNLPGTVAAGTEGMLRVELDGAPNCVLPPSYESCRRTADVTYMLPPWNYYSWYLYNIETAMPDVSPGRIDLLLPPGHRAAAMGVVPTVTDNADGTSTWSFVVDAPTEQFAFAAGVFEEVVADVGGFPARGLFEAGAGRADMTRLMIEDASLLAPVFADLWGAPPIEEVQYVVAPGNTPFAGTEFQGMVLLNDVVFDPAVAYLLPETAHELGHLWWGSMTSGLRDAEVGFFSESLAEYALWRGLGEVKGEATRTSGVRMNAVWYMYRRPSAGDVPVLSDPRTTLGVYAVYHKGSCVARTLEQAAGVAAFDAGLQAMIDTGPMGATVAGLLAAIRDAGGPDLTPYVSKWLSGTGYPLLTVETTTTTAATGGYDVAVHVSGDDFPLRLPVALRLGDGTTVQGVIDYAAGAGETTLHAAVRPAAVEVDSDWTAVREIHSTLLGDVTLDGRVDGADLLEVALRVGGFLPDTRRVDGRYDPLYDIDTSERIDNRDFLAVVAAAAL